MAIFFTSLYIIDPANQNYIKAITTYNKYGFIHSINGKTCDAIRASKLPQILQEHDLESQIKIVVRIADSNATIGMFPEFRAEELKQLLNFIPLDNDKITRNAVKMIDYYEDKDKYSGGLCIIVDEPKLESLSKQEAFATLLKIHERRAISGAIHLPASKTIVFQSDNTNLNYMMSYGEQSSLEDMPIFSCDIDDGFTDKYTGTDEVYKSTIQELQKHFLQWKQNGYDGPILPDSTAKFNFTNTLDDKLTVEPVIVNQMINSTPKPMTGLFPHPSELLTEDILLNVKKLIRESEESIAHKKAIEVLEYFKKSNSSAGKRLELDLQKLSALQAIIIANDLSQSQELSLTGMAHFSEIKRILFQYNGVDHILKYGNDAYLVPMTPVFLDQYQGIVGEGKITEVRRQLDKLHTRWKDSEFFGNMIAAADVGFEKVFTPSIQLKDINNLDSLLQYQIENYNQKYNLNDKNAFIEFVRDMYWLLKLDVEHHDFFEYCIFDACGLLPIAKEFSTDLNLRFWHSVEDIQHNMVYNLAPIYFGISDKKNPRQPEQLSAGKHSQLMDFAQSLEKACQEKLDFSTKVKACSNNNTLQHCLPIYRHAAIRAFLANPLLIAKFLIDHTEQINDKEFVMRTCKQLLSGDLDKYRNLHNGPNDAVIDNLSLNLNALKFRYNLNTALYGNEPIGSSYDIDPNDSNYINTIVTYNKNSWIIELDGVTCNPEISVAKLPELLAERKNDNTINILIATKPELCMDAILPAFYPENIKASDGKFNQKRVDYNSSKLNEFFNKDVKANDATLLDPMNNQEAFVLLSQLSATKNLSGAIHFPAIDALLFKLDNQDQCYVLCWTKDYSEVITIPTFGFDLDDGFDMSAFARKNYYNYILKTAESVHSELQKQFKYWKEHHYQGPLFTNDTLFNNGMCIAGKMIQQYYVTDHGMLMHSFSYKPDPFAFSSADAAYKDAEFRHEIRLHEQELAKQRENRYKDKSINDIANELRSLSDVDFLEHYNYFFNSRSNRSGQTSLLLHALHKPESRRQYENSLLNGISDKLGLTRYATSPYSSFNQGQQRVDQLSTDVDLNDKIQVSIK